MSTSNSEQTPSTTQVLFGSQQGRMLLLLGSVYTLIVSLSLGMFYFMVGWEVTVAVTAVYVVLTSVLVYFRAPMRRLVFPALLVFTVVPVSFGALGVLAVRALL